MFEAVVSINDKMSVRYLVALVLQEVFGRGPSLACKIPEPGAGEKWLQAQLYTTQATLGCLW